MQCNKMVSNLSWWCQGHTFTSGMRVLNLGAYDAILGMDWMKKHSPMVMDWEHHCLAFPHNNTIIQFQGVQAPAVEVLKELPVEQLVKWCKGNEVWVMTMVAEDTTISPTPIASEIQEVLHQFSDVFDTPIALSLERHYDHAISLNPDAISFNARPYRKTGQTNARSWNYCTKHVS